MDIDRTNLRLRYWQKGRGRVTTEWFEGQRKIGTLDLSPAAWATLYDRLNTYHPDGLLILEPMEDTAK